MWVRWMQGIIFSINLIFHVVVVWLLSLYTSFASDWMDDGIMFVWFWWTFNNSGRHLFTYCVCQIKRLTTMLFILLLDGSSNNAQTNHHVACSCSKLIFIIFGVFVIMGLQTKLKNVLELSAKYSEEKQILICTSVSVSLSANH